MSERRPRRDRFGQPRQWQPPLTHVDQNHERLLTCTIWPVIVGGYVDDIDADKYACIDCRASERRANAERAELRAVG